MKTFSEFVTSNWLSLPKIKREIKNSVGMNVSTHKNTNMGSHAGIKLSYGNGASTDTFKISRLNSSSFSIEVHNNDQALLDKIESYLKTTGYVMSRQAFNITVGK